MSQKIVTLCDAHQLHDEEVEGATWTVTLTPPGNGGPTTWEVDLCTDDAKGLVDLGTMLDAVGRTVGAKRRKVATAARNAPRTAEQVRRAPTPTGQANTGRNAAIEIPHTEGAWPCPVEGCGNVSATRNGLRSHLAARHDMTLGEASGAPTPYPCTEPGCGRAFTHRQGLGAHRRAAHGVRSASVSGAA